MALCGETTSEESVLLTGAVRQGKRAKRRRRGQAKRLRVAELVDVTGIPPTEIRSERIHRRLASLDWPHV